MSVWARHWALAQRVGGEGASRAARRCVLNDLADWMVGEDAVECCPTIEAIAFDTGLNRQTVMKAVAALVEQGIVSRRFEWQGLKKRAYYRFIGYEPSEWKGSLRPDVKNPEGPRFKNSESPDVRNPEGTKSHTTEGTKSRTTEGTKSHTTEGTKSRTVTGNKQGITGNEQGFFVESPSGDFDDAPPTLFDDETTEKVERSASRIPACPYKKLVDLYHEVCPMLPTVTVLTPGRKTQLKARWTEIYREEHCTSEAECLENFRFIFNRVAASRFLTGRTDPGPNRSRPFVANLDWLIKAANFVKVCENRYSN